MTSTSSDGSSVITLQFNLDLNIDVAEQEVQPAINAAGTYLPADLPNPPIYTKANPADAPILTLALTSDTMPLSKVEDLADTRLAQKISQLPGVGLVSISGGQKPAVRIQANPTALGFLRPEPGGSAQRRSRPPTSTRPRATSTARTSRTHRRQRPVAVERRLRADDRGLPQWRAGAAVGRGQRHRRRRRTSRQAAWMNETPAVIVNIQRQPGANIIEVVDRVKALLPQLAGLAAQLGARQDSDRPDHHHPRLGRRTCSSS